MLWTGRQSVDFVNLLKSVIIHHSAIMVVLRALFTQSKTLIGTVNPRFPVLTAHTLKMTLNKLLFASDAEVHFILKLIFLRVVDHEVVLKGILFSLTFEKD